MTSAKLYAGFLLGKALLAVLFKRLFGRGPRGIALFRSNFAADRLSPMSPEQRAEIATFSRCIACGACDRGDGERMAASRGAYPGTMALMLASSRSIPDFPAAEDALAWIDDAALAQKEGLCPVQVPMRRIAAFIRAHAAPEA